MPKGQDRNDALKKAGQLRVAVDQAIERAVVTLGRRSRR
jgi:hypothetical protein